MGKFIGRRQELSALQDLYDRDGFQMAVVYGRRRVGKSTLLREFAKNKMTIYYTAVRSSSEWNLHALGKCVKEVLLPELSNMDFPSYEELFDFVGKQAKEKRILFVLDEFPYLAEQDASLLSRLQKAIDTDWQDGQLFLVLSGSSISFMEDEVLSEKSPLFGRRTCQLKIKPFNFWEAGEFVPSYNPEEKAICYGVTGGIAKYLSFLDDSRSLDENIQRLFFRTSGYLYEEPQNLLSQEFRQVSTYNDIISAVASGRTRLNQIADLTHMNPSKVSHATSNLIMTGILRKDYAITDERNKQKVRYVLSDHMFRFWYQFVAPNVAMIEVNRGDECYEHIVKPRIPDFMGDVFEEMCRYYTIAKGTFPDFPCLITRIGKWWGTNPMKREETDIDVVGLDSIRKTAMIGECKFKNEVLDKKIFDALQERQGLIDHHYRVVGYLLFSKSGFSDWILEHSKDESIYPISLSKMYDER